jgi:hypothetical protein
MMLIDASSWLIGVQAVYLFLMFLFAFGLILQPRIVYEDEDRFGRVYELRGHIFLIGKGRDRVAGIIMMLCIASTVALRLSEIDGEALSILRYAPSVIMVSLGIYIEYRVARRTSATNPAID